MIYQLYAVKDVVSGQFHEILSFVNAGTAERYFVQLCQESKIATDLQLYHLGEYNNETGEITHISAKFVRSGVTFNEK